MAIWSSALGQATRFLAQADWSAPAGGSGAAPTGGGAPPAGGGMIQLVMFVGIFVVFWLLVLRPQQKRAKVHKSFLDDLKVGTRVVTSSGLFGKITDLQGNEVKLEIADRVVVRVLKSQIAGPETQAAEAVANAQPR